MSVWITVWFWCVFGGDFEFKVGGCFWGVVGGVWVWVQLFSVAK